MIQLQVILKLQQFIQQLFEVKAAPNKWCLQIVLDLQPKLSLESQLLSEVVVKEDVT